MKNYQKTDTDLWRGRLSNRQLYLHQKIQCIDLINENLPIQKKKSFALLGYQCDEGVKRNQGRIGSAKGPDSIRKIMGPLSNHFPDETNIYDIGNIACIDSKLEEAQQQTSTIISQVLNNNIFPIVLGGGHDLAYAHYNGIKKKFPNKNIGIINLDAHFDLRKTNPLGNSGTPFFQIANENKMLSYLCLGIQKASNNKELFEMAKEIQATYLFNYQFNMHNRIKILKTIDTFIKGVDLVYLTIDLDGFSSAYAPGVSAPSSLGFSPDIAMEVIQYICESKKLISADIVELNPNYDINFSTAHLASRIVYSIIDWN